MRLEHSVEHGGGGTFAVGSDDEDGGLSQLGVAETSQGISDGAELWADSPGSTITEA
jgi:hypothetical protein